MTLQQLEYILAVNQFRHFAKAAEYCRITQPTLSAMIQKLEEELDTKIFDRSQQPVCPTPIGIHIIEQAQNVLVQANRIKNIIEEEKHSLCGVFKLGILPTIAPYLLPRFFPQLMKKYPQLDIRVVEMKTNDIKKALQTEEIDAGIVASLAGMEEFRQIVERNGVDFHTIAVELTESRNDTEYELVLDRVMQFKSLGVCTYLDDFGTGYSNLHCISDMNPGYVKMDKDFTAKAMSCERDYELFKKIIEMVHSIGIRICVEGIEKEDWHLKMKELQADYLQGYFFGKPCEKKKFMEEFVCNPHNNGVW